MMVTENIFRYLAILKSTRLDFSEARRWRSIFRYAPLKITFLRKYFTYSQQNLGKIFSRKQLIIFCSWKIKCNVAMNVCGENIFPLKYDWKTRREGGIM